MYIKRKYRKFYLMLIAVLFVASFFANDSNFIKTDGEIRILYLDVGQGDCEIISLPDGRNIIIDGGTNEGADNLVSEIKKFGITRFDYMIATHPHEDHIGGLDEVAKNFEIGEVYMPNKSSSTKSFTDLAMALKKSGAKVNPAKAGVLMIDENSVRAEFLAPSSSVYEDTNDYSAVLKLTYGNCSFLFTGDAQSTSEYEMLSKNMDVRADVLKVAHHGSHTSTTEEFLYAVSPEYAIIEVGEDNSYGHPHRETLKTLSGIDIYRTDVHGTIILNCNGQDINITTEK